MKKTWFLLIIFALAMLYLPTNAKSKKLKYAKNIQYYGEVDNNKQPLGRGQLQLTGYYEKALDIINGDFKGKTITNAEVIFGTSNWLGASTYSDRITAKYEGIMEFGIKEANGRIYLVYNLTDGILTVIDKRNGGMFSIPCKPQDHCAIERSAAANEINVYQECRGNYHKENGDIEYVYTFFDDIGSNKGTISFSKEEQMSKAKMERLKAEAEQKLKTPKGLAEKIIQLIDDKNQPISEIESLTDKLLAMEKTDEQKQAVKSVIRECQIMGSGYDSENDSFRSFSHEGTERGKQEMALAALLQEYLIEGGDMQELIDYAYRCRQNGDFPKAKQYFQQAADKGNAMAMRGLAFCYEDENNNEEAEKWYMKTVETDATVKNCVDAMDFFRKTNQPNKILKILELSAENSKNRDAMLRLGDIFRNGKDWDFKKSGITVTKNLSTAMKWYRKARETGSRAALFFMADCYWTGGTGITQNRAEAAKLYKQMMDEAGLLNLNISEAEPDERSKANYRYGYCLETGTGVVKNIPRAWDLYCNSNEADAYYRRGVMMEKRWVYERLRPDLRKQQVRQLYQTAANMGHKQAQQALNRMYR